MCPAGARCSVTATRIWFFPARFASYMAATLQSTMTPPSTTKLGSAMAAIGMCPVEEPRRPLGSCRPFP